MLKLINFIDRYGRWILAVLMLLFIFTGLGITKSIMDQRLAKLLHENILPVPFYFLILAHLFPPCRSKILQWNLFKSERTADIYTAILFILLLVSFLWLHFR